MVLVPTIIVVICAAISWIVTRSRLRWRVALDAIAFLPHPVPNLLFALAIAYLALLISNVIPVYGTIYVLMAVYVVCWISFGTRVLNNSMIQVHRELEEAAQVGGASTFRILAKIIAPLIKPGLIYTWIWTSLVGLPRAHDGGISRFAEEPGALYLYLGPVAWRRARRCRGDRDHDDRGHVAAGDEFLGLCAQAATSGGRLKSVRSKRSNRSSRFNCFLI